MALNQLGLGLTFTAKDLASATMKDVAGNLGDVEHSAEEAAKATEELGEAMTKAGGAAVAFGAAGLAFLGVATDEAYKMEQALKAVATRVDEATFPMEDMEDLAGGLAEQFGTLPIDQAKAMFQAVAAGATSAAQAEALMTGANALAKAGNADLGQSIGVVTQLLKAYGLGFEHAEDVADAMYVATKHAGVGVDEMGIMLEHLAPSAARAGIGVEQMLGAVSMMGQAGLRGRAAMSGLKAIIDTLVQPSKDARQEAARLGVDISEAAIKAKGMPEILREITSSANLNKDSLSRLFGSVEAGTAVMALMRNGGKDYAAAMNEIANSTGAAADAAAAMVSPEQQLNAAWATAKETMGAALLPLVHAFARALKLAVDGFNALPGPLKAGITLFLAAAFAGTLVAGAIVGIAGAVLMLDTALTPLLVAVAAVAILASGLTAAFIAMGVGVAAAVTAIKYAWDNNFGGLATTLREFYAQVKLVWDGISQLFDSGGFSGAVRTEMDKAKNAGLKQFVIDVYMWGSRIKAFFGDLVDSFEKVMKALPIFKELRESFSKLGDALGAMFGGPNDPERNASKFDAFATAGAKVGNVLGAIAGKIATVVGTVVKWMVDAATAASEFIGAHQEAFDRLGDAIGAFMSAIGEVFDALGQLSAAFSTNTQGAQGFGDTVAGAVVSAVSSLAGVVRSVADHIKTGIERLQEWKGKWDELKASAMAAIDPIIQRLQPLIDLIDKARAALHLDPIGGGGAAQPGHPGKRDAAAQAAIDAAVGVPGLVARNSGGAGSLPPTRGGPNPAATAVQAASSAQAAVAGGGGNGIAEAVQRGLAGRAPAPVHVHAPILLDGEKIGEAIVRTQRQGGARGFEPQPMPGG